MMNNLLKMERYQLFRNRIYWLGMLGMTLAGIFSADTYLPEILKPGAAESAPLVELLNIMVYDSTMLLVFVSTLLALTLGQEFSWRTIDQAVCAGHPRSAVFAAKVAVCLLAYNLMMLLYPIAGCLRELPLLGTGDVNMLLFHLARAVVYSFLQNSAFFLIPVLCCFCLRSSAKAVAATALITFGSGLYLAYGMLFRLPVSFLPIFQIRAVVTSDSAFLPGALLVALVWGAALLGAGWRVFRRCELR